MVQHLDDEVSYYYDLHPTEEDLMGETSLHRNLIEYLTQVLRWLFDGQRCAIYANLNFYYTINGRDYPVAPDIAVLKGVPLRDVTSWRIGRTGPSPQVVLEIASPETWHNDLYLKPTTYARMGVQEYFAYDPYRLPLSGEASKAFFGQGTDYQLFGWRLDATTGRMDLLPVGPAGQVWSPQLDSILGPEPGWLRLYDRSGQVRLTKAEALAEKLRSLGIDPDQI